MPPATNQLTGFLFACAATLPACADAAMGAGALACGNLMGAPQFVQVLALPEFSLPQFEQVITFGVEGAACITCPAWRALPSFKSAPHCEQVSAVAGLRVPQNPQWMSAPALAACTTFSSVINFSSAARWNWTLSGWGAPQFWQFLTGPGLRVSQFGHTHSNCTTPLLLLCMVYSLSIIAYVPSVQQSVHGLNGIIKNTFEGIEGV